MSNVLSVYTLVVLCYVGPLLCVPLCMTPTGFEDSAKYLHRSLEMTCNVELKGDVRTAALLTLGASSARHTHTLVLFHLPTVLLEPPKCSPLEDGGGLHGRGYQPVCPPRVEIEFSNRNSKLERVLK